MCVSVYVPVEVRKKAILTAVLSVVLTPTQKRVILVDILRVKKMVRFGVWEKMTPALTKLTAVMTIIVTNVKLVTVVNIVA